MTVDTGDAALASSEQYPSNGEVAGSVRDRVNRMIQDPTGALGEGARTSKRGLLTEILDGNGHLVGTYITKPTIDGKEMEIWTASGTDEESGRHIAANVKRNDQNTDQLMVFVNGEQQHVLDHSTVRDMNGALRLGLSLPSESAPPSPSTS